MFADNFKRELHNQTDINNWSPQKVVQWLSGLCEDATWLNSDYILDNNISGKKLAMMTAIDLKQLGASKVDMQELILHSIEKLILHNYSLTSETLQRAILRLSCQSRSLQQLVAKAQSKHITSSPKTTVLSSDFRDSSNNQKQRVTLETLSSISDIAGTVMHVTEILNCKPFSKHADYRHMKSLILALSIELTSTAQRDQFVERPNDIIEKSAKTLADYCDRIVHSTGDCLMITCWGEYK